MIFAFSIKDFGHPKFLKSQFGHPVMKILAESLDSTICSGINPFLKLTLKPPKQGLIGKGKHMFQTMARKKDKGSQCISKRSYLGLSAGFDGY